MNLKHLALAVRDQQRSIDFYAKYFGFDPATARRYPDDFGFHADSPEEVRRLRSRIVADGIDLVEDEVEEEYVGFKCLDPDNHVVEVAWSR